MRKIAIFSLLGLWILPISALAGTKPAELNPESQEKLEERKKSASEKEAEVGAPEETPPLSGIGGFFQRMNRGISGFLDRTLKGSYRVATLGQSELKSYEIQEPEKGSDEPTKIKISLPGT